MVIVKNGHAKITWLRFKLLANVTLSKSSPSEPESKGEKLDWDIPTKRSRDRNVRWGIGASVIAI